MVGSGVIGLTLANTNITHILQHKYSIHHFSIKICHYPSWQAFPTILQKCWVQPTNRTTFRPLGLIIQSRVATQQLRIIPFGNHVTHIFNLPHYNHNPPIMPCHHATSIPCQHPYSTCHATSIPCQFPYSTCYATSMPILHLSCHVIMPPKLVEGQIR